jgi:integrase
MSDALAHLSAANLTLAPEVVERARENFRASKADATWRAYKTDWEDWELWATARKLSPLPADPAAICLFLAERSSRLKIATLEGRLAGISQAHKLAGLPSPTHDPSVKAQMAGIRRRLGVKQAQKAAADLPTLRAMLETIPREGLAGKRDRAILLLGFGGAFRRSEITALTFEDLEFRPEGVLVTIRKSKTDQEGVGRIVPIAKAPDPDVCPVEALRSWLGALAPIAKGHVFRSLTKWGTVRDGKMSDQVVALVVQGAAEKAGFDPSRFGGHSLRAGHVTQALAGGATDRQVQEVTGHQKVEMLNRYKRDVNPFARGSGSALYTEKK